MLEGCVRFWRFLLYSRLQGIRLRLADLFREEFLDGSGFVFLLAACRVQGYGRGFFVHRESLSLQRQGRAEEGLAVDVLDADR